MTTPDPELLRRFATERSEPAFAELVRRHADLVHSAALRQVDGDAATAEDVTQAVFTDLARKAARLTGHPSLTGWLYTSTRFLAGNARRAEHRRRQRERQAHTMNQLLVSDGPEPDWQQLRPVLDEAMHELGEAHREAVLLRFFERRPLAEVGALLGLSENAARMRVDRALEKLRKLLDRRGIDSTAAALAVALTGRAVAAAPVGLANRVSQTAVLAPIGSGGLVFALLALMTRIPTKLALALATLAVVLTPVVWPRMNPGRDPTGTAETKGPTTAPAIEEGSAATVPATVPETLAAIPPADDALGHLRLTLLTADSSRPVPNVLVERGWVTDANFLSLRDGTVDVTYPLKTKELRLTTRADGFADTRLKWSLERGEVVPKVYTIRLERAVPIGGTVVDVEGKPVGGAKVGFNHEEEPTVSSRTENHDFGWIEVTTDEEGRWRINRIAQDMIGRIFGSANHPEHVGSAAVFVSRAPEAEKTLRAATHVFRLGGAVTVTGTVVDSTGSPVAEANVAVGWVDRPGRREAVTEADGNFLVRGCPPGKQPISVQAKGYAVTTDEVELGVDSKPLRLVVRAGATLRLRVVNHEGQPVPDARAWLSSVDAVEKISGSPIPASVLAKVVLQSDAEGRIVWNEAPATEVSFDVQALGTLPVRGFKVRPDGQEHTVTLTQPSALTISGTVRDAETGNLIPKFRIIAGWPEPDIVPGTASLTTNAAWSSEERFWLNFGGGQFRHTFAEGVIGGTKNPGYIFKFEADGYASFVSRIIAADEGEVRLDVTLRPAAASTITVLTPDGRPAANMSVALVSVGGHATLVAAEFKLAYNRNCILVTTDGRGRFQLPGDDTLIRVMAAHATGFAEATPLQLAGQTTWTLLPWGRIEGRWISGGKPVSGREVWAGSFEGMYGGLLRLDLISYKAQTDENGNFHFDHVLPGRAKVTRLLVTDRGNGNVSYGYGRSTEVEVLAGETANVILGSEGYKVTGRLVWPPGPAFAPHWRFMGSVCTPLPQPPAEVRGNKVGLHDWQQSPEQQRLIKAAKRFPLSVQPDDTLYAEEIEPGNYRVDFMAYVDWVTAADGKLLANARADSVFITIPDEPAMGTIDLGAITLQMVPPATPVVSNPK